jgi:hypothetical protein
MKTKTDITLLCTLPLFAACGMQVRTWSSTPSAPPAPTSATAPATTSTAVVAPAAPAPIPKEQACSWQPDLVIRQHEGGGNYGPIEYPLDLRLDSFVWDRAIKDFSAEAKVKETGAGSSSIYFDCDDIKKVKSDAEVLGLIKHKVDHPELVLAAHYQPRADWKVDTDNGNPVSKSRVIIVYSRREPQSM